MLFVNLERLIQKGFWDAHYDLSHPGRFGRDGLQRRPGSERGAAVRHGQVRGTRVLLLAGRNQDSR